MGPLPNSDDRSDEFSNQIGKRIDSLRRIPLGASTILAICLASFFTYYDFSNYAYISPLLRETWDVSDSEIALGASMTILGYVIGSLGITAYADLYGRRPALIISVLVLATGSILAASSQNMVQLEIFRFITGVGIGSEIALVGTYIAEMSPRSRRGMYTSFVVVLGWAGITLSGPVALLLIQVANNLEWIGDVGAWRIILGLAVVPAFLALILRMRMPESLRWLLAKGKVKEANRFLTTLALEPIKEPSFHHHKYKKLNEILYPQTDKKWFRKIDVKKIHDVVPIFRKIPRLGRLLFLVVIWSLVLVPIYASLLLVIEYIDQGYDIFESVSINVLASTGFVAGGLWSIAVADRIERKYQIFLASLLMGAGFILRGLLVQDYSGLVISSFIAFSANAWLITSLITYTGENFPTSIRSTGSGIVEGLGRLLGSVGLFIFVILEPFGFFNLMIGLSLFPFVAAIAIVLLGRNTLNLPLETLND